MITFGIDQNGLVGRQRLDGENVQHCPAEPAQAQCSRQSGFVHQLATRDINHNRRPFHLPDRGRIENLIGTDGPWCGQHDHVGHLHHPIEIAAPDHLVDAGGSVPFRITAHADNAHAERLRTGGDRLAKRAEADDPHRLARNQPRRGVANQFVREPGMLFLASKRLRQPPGERKEACHDVLGNRRRLDAS